jgi:hypothetical protein
MNHKLLEEWLFTYLESDDLEAEQSAQLQDHLRDCQTCQNLARSWREVDRHLLGAKLIAPRAGFTDRWQERFERDRQLMQKRQSMAALVFALGGAAVLFGSLILLLWPWIGMPEVFVWSWIYRLSTFVVYVEPANNLISILLQSFSGRISPFWWILLAGLLSELAVLWLVSYRWLTNPRRVIVDETTN